METAGAARQVEEREDWKQDEETLGRGIWEEAGKVEEEEEAGEAAEIEERRGAGSILEAEEEEQGQSAFGGMHSVCDTRQHWQTGARTRLSI